MHSADPFLLELLFIFLAAKACGEIFERLRVPAVLGEILAGILLGPYGLGWINPSDSMFSMAEIGAIFLLFSVGLETPPKQLISVGKRALSVAAGGVAAPFLAGFLVLWMLHRPTHEAIFIATAMVATSVGITARVLSDLDVLNTRAAQIILASAVFDDIMGMLLLGVVGGLVTAAGIHWLGLGLVLGEAVGFTLFMMFIAPKVVGRLGRHLERANTRNAPLIAALAICLALSLAAQRIGMAAIVGAFFAGLAFAEYAPEWELRPRVSAITEFLAPYFFFTMGARLNLTAFDSELLIVAVVITVLAVLTKIIGCGLPVLHEGWRTALKVGIGMVPRGEVGLIVALIGLNMKMVTDSGYAIVIFMTGCTTMLAPPLLRIMFQPQEAVAAAASVTEPTS